MEQDRDECFKTKFRTKGAELPAEKEGFLVKNRPYD